MKIDGAIESDEDKYNSFSPSEDHTPKAYQQRMTQQPPKIQQQFQSTAQVRQSQGAEMYQKKAVNQYFLNAAETGNTDSVQDALNKAKYGKFAANVNSHNQEDWTTLHIAANEGHLNIAQILIDNNTNINAQTKCLRTALHLACMRGKTDIVKLLLSKGAKVDL